MNVCVRVREREMFSPTENNLYLLKNYGPLLVNKEK